jgi:ACS family hexuronate transporter-like MFS transporter
MPQTPIPAATSTPEAFKAVFTQRAMVVLVGLLLSETTINYIDRQVVSVLAPTLKAEFHLSNSLYALVINVFMATYALSYAFAGWAIDRLGVGRGLSLSVIWWSVADMATALARGPFSLGMYRSLLAVGEGGAWPAFAKAVALWVPKEARALAMGACNSGSSLGAMLAPPLVVWIAARGGWRACFVATGAIGLVWCAAFWLFQRLHPEMARAEAIPQLAADKLPWMQLVRYRQTWAVFACRFMADPMWYFFVFWMPDFLSKERHLNLAGIGAVAGIPFLAAAIANFAAGYAMLRLERAGWSVNRTRKTVMAISALLSPIGILAVFVQSLFWTMAVITLAVFCWMFWSVAVHTLSGDYFPPRAVASVYGIAGTGSTVATVFATWMVGHVLDLTHSYTPVFIGIGVTMPMAMIIGFTLMKRVEPVEGL